MSRHGRDQRGRPAAPDAEGGRVLAWAQGAAAPPSRDREPRDESPPTDELDSFDDLGLEVAPVSVTPPRTWRRAAWIAVGASCVALTVLVFAAARLADQSFGRMDAFPGLPTGGLLTARPPGPPPQHQPAAIPGASSDSTSAGGSPSVTPRNTAGATASAPGGPVTGTAQPGGTGEPTSGGPTAPTVTVKPTTGEPPVSAEELLSATRQFYELLPENLEQAWDMVGPQVKSQGYESFRRQWGNARDVQLQKVVVDPDTSTVETTVRVLTPGSGERVQRFELTFRKSGRLIIEEMQPLPGGSPQPTG